MKSQATPVRDHLVANRTDYLGDVLAHHVPTVGIRIAVLVAQNLEQREGRAARHFLLCRGQWFVAAMRPPHLAAILPWQGTYDFYRDRTRQDGIYASGFLKRWTASLPLQWRRRS